MTANESLEGGARRRIAGAGAVAVVLAAVAVVALRDRPETSTQVVAGPAPSEVVVLTEPPSTTIPLEFVAGQPIGTRIDFQTPAGWDTLLAQGDRMMVATRPLSEADKALALLARNDTAFSAAFPADAVVVVVGGDPVEAKYGTGPNGEAIAPGPAYALGPERTLPGGVKVRRGDVPQSGVRIASYAGRAAPAARLQEAEAIVAGLHLVRTGDPKVLPPPPPPGSRAGLPGGPLPVAEAGLPEVARTAASGATLVLVAGRDCAYLRTLGSQPGSEPWGGACGARPAATAIAQVGQPILVVGLPGSSNSTVSIVRTGGSIARFTARLVDGRTATPAIGTDGWALVVDTVRVVAVTGTDLQGRTLPEQPLA